MGATLAAGRSGVPDFVAVDMGGTSYDVCLVRGGKPEIKTDDNWRYRYYISLPMVDVDSVGAGGGSIAQVRQGALLVGPESAGAQPGPVCYGRGGTHPTVTDADAVLGFLPVDGFANGRMRLDVDAARAAIDEHVAQPLGMDVVEAAWGIERIVNANMANAVRKVVARYGADPRALAMIAYGGNGPVHAWAQAIELGIRRILVPKAAPMFSALGVCVADHILDLSRAYVSPLSRVDVARIRALFAELGDEANKELAPANLPEGDVDVALFAQMCYPGQNWDMSVPAPEGADLTDANLLDLAGRFHAQHETDRGFAFRNQQPLLRGLRLVATGRSPKPPTLAVLGTTTDAAQARTGSRPVWFGDGVDRHADLRRRPTGAGCSGHRARADPRAVHGRRRRARRQGPARRERQLRDHRRRRLNHRVRIVRIGQHATAGSRARSSWQPSLSAWPPHPPPTPRPAES